LSGEADVRDQDQICPFGKSLAEDIHRKGQTPILTQTGQTSLSMIAAGAIAVLGRAVHAL
jgi:hypothetical protein